MSRRETNDFFICTPCGGSLNATERDPVMRAKPSTERPTQQRAPRREEGGSMVGTQEAERTRESLKMWKELVADSRG